MRYLSKSDFRAARSCATKLYYRKAGYPSGGDSDDYRELLIEGGYMVEATARVLHPGGIVVDDTSGEAFDLTRAAERTAELLERDIVTLFGATFVHGSLTSRADIVRKRGNVIDLVEVKAKSFDTDEQMERHSEGRPSVFRSRVKPHGIVSGWQETIEDVAFQHVVMTAALPDFRVRPHLLLVDSQKFTPIESLHAQFEIEWGTRPDGSRSVTGGRFTGDPEELRAGHTLVEVDVSEEVELVTRDVEQAIALFQASLSPSLTKLPPMLSSVCRECEFNGASGAAATDGAVDARDGFRECWGTLADASPHVLELFKVGSTKIDKEPLIHVLTSQGKSGLFDVPVEKLVKKDGTIGSVGARQLVQIEHTRSGKPWVNPALAATVRTVTYPLHFIDFETSALAVPYHAGMRPYEQVAFQWSCHTVAEPGADPVHTEWINTVDAWPNIAFADSLQEQLGDVGTVLMWAQHERTVLRAVSEQLARYNRGTPSLRAWIEAITTVNDIGPSRLLDMHELCSRHFFHPGMSGRTSIKKVLDALWQSEESLRARCTQLMGFDASTAAGPYAALPPLEIDNREESVREGTGAMRAYQAMLYGEWRENRAAQAQWRQLLLQYCKLDTLAMVLIWEHWERVTAP